MISAKPSSGRIYSTKPILKMLMGKNTEFFRRRVCVDVLEAVQARLDADPQAMRRRRETVEHPFGTLKARMGATHFLMKTLPKVAAEMALHVLAYNLTRAMNIIGIKPLLAAIKA